MAEKGQFYLRVDYIDKIMVAELLDAYNFSIPFEQIGLPGFAFGYAAENGWVSGFPKLAVLGP